MVNRLERTGTHARGRAHSAAARSRQTERDLDRLAWLLDSSIRLPGGFRIGLDGLVGLIPGFGDAVGALLSLYIVARASALGIPKAVVGRMLLNVAAESAIGVVPVLGDVFDFAFKANRRNVALLRRYAADARGEQTRSVALLAGVFLFVILLAAFVVAVGIVLARWLISAFGAVAA